jgi:hypothetical protein
VVTAVWSAAFLLTAVWSAAFLLTAIVGYIGDGPLQWLRRPPAGPGQAPIR